MVTNRQIRPFPFLIPIKPVQQPSLTSSTSQSYLAMFCFPVTMPATIIIMTTMLLHACNTEVTSINPIYFRDISHKAYVYTSAIPLIYSEPYALNENDLEKYINQTFKTSEQCIPDGDKNCKNNKILTETLKNTKQLLHNEAKATLFRIQNTGTFECHVRRGIGDAIRGLLKDWCNIALMSDTQELSENDNKNGKKNTSYKTA